jgi:hypothetical protein
MAGTLVAGMEVGELRRALAAATAGLLREAHAVPIQGGTWMRSELEEFRVSASI